MRQQCAAIRARVVLIAASTVVFLWQASPGDAKIRALMTEAFTYGTSSKGILSAALKGDGFTFMK